MDKPYEEMTDDELAEARIKLDKKIQALREEKLKIQQIIDSRYVPPVHKPGDHIIGFG
jgi:hypothetical protein